MSGEFLLIECKCKNRQIVFNKPSSIVKCLVCNKILVEPTGGKGIVNTKIIRRIRN